MFGLFKKEKFICIGVNPKVDLLHLESIITPLELHERIKNKIFTKDEIKQLQIKLNELNIPYKDLEKEFNWILDSPKVQYKKKSFTIVSLISGVRKEFEESEIHNEVYQKYIAPSVTKSFAKGPGEIDYGIEEIESEILEKGVIVPLHFDRVQVTDWEILNEKTGESFRNSEITKRLEPFSLEPKVYQKIETLIDNIVNSIDEGKTDIETDEKSLVEILQTNEKVKGRYAEINGYYYLGIANLKLGKTEKANNYFKTITGLKTDISQHTIAKDFLRPIGELYEEKCNQEMALYWYNIAVTFSTNIGLKKKIKELETILNK